MSKAQLTKNSKAVGKTPPGIAKKKKPLVISIVIVVVFVLVTTGVTLISLNVFNLRDSVMAFIIPQDETTTEITNEQDETASIQSEIVRLNDLQLQLDTRSSELDFREEELNEREILVSSLIEENENIQSQLSRRVDSLSMVTTIYEEMEPEQAALILSNMTDSELALLILKELDQAIAAEILGMMDASLAAQFLERMLLENQE